MIIVMMMVIVISLRPRLYMFQNVNKLPVKMVRHRSFLIVLTWTTFVPNLKTFPPVDFGRKFVMEIKTHLLPFSKTKQI